MPEKKLRLDEVERIARDFIMKKWNGEVAEFNGNLLCPSEGVHKIEGRAKIPQRVKTGEPKHLPDNAPFYETYVADVEILFKLQVSVKDRKVIGYEKTRSTLHLQIPNLGQVSSTNLQALLNYMELTHPNLDRVLESVNDKRRELLWRLQRSSFYELQSARNSSSKFLKSIASFPSGRRTFNNPVEHSTKNMLSPSFFRGL